MTNTLQIDFNKLDSFTALPAVVSSICKYNNKKLSTDHKLIYVYLAKLEHDGFLNNSTKKGLQSFDAIMQRFGYGSKGSLTGYIQHLVDVGLLEKTDNGNGHANSYSINPINIDLVSYPAASHQKGSNKNKRSQAKEVSTEPKKVNNYPVAKRYREAFQHDSKLLKAFNCWMMTNDEENIQVSSNDVLEWKNSLKANTDETVIATPFNERKFSFVPTPIDPDFIDMAMVQDDCEQINECHEDITQVDTSILKTYLNPNVVDEHPSKGLGWFCSWIFNKDSSKRDCIDYLSIIKKRGAWNDFKPTQDQLNSLLEKLKREESKQTVTFNCTNCGIDMYLCDCDSPLPF